MIGTEGAGGGLDVLSCEYGGYVIGDKPVLRHLVGTQPKSHAVVGTEHLFQPRRDIDFHVIVQEGLVEAVIGRIERESHQFGILLLFSGDTGLGGFRRKLAQRAVHAVLHVYRRHVRVGSLLEIDVDGSIARIRCHGRRCDVGVLFHRQGKHGNHAQQYNHHRDNARKHRAVYKKSQVHFVSFLGVMLMPSLTSPTPSATMVSPTERPSFTINRLPSFRRSTVR